MAEYRAIPISELREPPLPVRAAISTEGISELADSIRAVGIIQPLIVTPSNGLYEIIAGHRRYLAACEASLSHVPTVIYDDPGIAREAVMLHENLYRADLSAAEEGLFFAELIERYDLTEDALSKMVRQKPDYINERLDLVRGDPEILQAVLENKITFTAAKELRRVNPNVAAQVLNKTPAQLTGAQIEEIAAQRRYLLHQAVESAAPARTLRGWVDSWKLSLIPQPPPHEPAAPPVPGGPPPHSGLSCWLCGGARDPQNLRLLYVHWYELDAVMKILRGAGIEVRA